MAATMRTATLVGGFAIVLLCMRRVGRRSGATGEEVTGPMPGDDVVSRPLWESTRAITIDVPPARVWPWIVQMGFPAYRAGWYTPYWLDRVQWGIRDRSSDEIRDDLQSLRVGDLVPDSLDWSVYFTVEMLEPEHALVLHSTRHLLPPMRAIDFTWAFVLQPIADDRTRLVIRARARYAPRWSWLALGVPYEIGDFLNSSNILRAVKKRSERGAATPAGSARSGGCAARRTASGRAAVPSWSPLRRPPHG